MFHFFYLVIFIFFESDVRLWGGMVGPIEGNWVCVTGYSEPLPYNGLFCGQLLNPS